MRFSKIRDVKSPSRAYEADAGIDFYIPNDVIWETFTLAPGTHITIPSGIRMEVPRDAALIAYEKSGVAVKSGLITGARVVDSGYQGEINIHLVNPTNKPVIITRGQKIIQFLLVPIVHSELIETSNKDIHPIASSRGTGGFGSSGS